MQGGERDREFLPSKGRWGTVWKRREERVVKTWHAPPHRPAGVRWAPHTHSRQPASLKLGLEAPSFWLPPGMERPPRRWGTLAPQQLPRIPSAVNPAGSQSRPHPQPPSPLLFPRWGLRTEEPVSSPSLRPPLSLPTPHAEAAKKMTCHAGVGAGAEPEPELSAHTRTLRHTAAARPPPATSLRRHLPSRPRRLGSAPAATPRPPLALSLAWGCAPASKKSSPKKAEKQVRGLQWDCEGSRGEAEGFLPSFFSWRGAG